MIQNVKLAFSPDQSVLNVRSSAQLLQGRSAADLSPAYAAPRSLVPHTNRPFGDRSGSTQRLPVCRHTCPINQSTLPTRQRSNSRSVGEAAKGGEEVASGLMAYHQLRFQAEASRRPRHQWRN